MQKAVRVILLSVVFACPGFVERSTPPSSSVPTASGTHAALSSAPDCRIQTC
jgi:hypothetical protein